MKILFENIVLNATLASQYASSNYPVDNLQNLSLSKRLQSSLDHDTVTITLDDDYGAITDIWYGFTNATKIIFRFYDYEGGLLFTLTIDDPEEWIGHEYFSGISNVDYIEMYYEGPQDVYIGGIGIGIGYTMPDPVASWTEDYADNSYFSESPFGQTGQNYVKPLMMIQFKFRDQTNEEKKEIRNLINARGQGFPLYVDFFDLNHEYMRPKYAKITKTPGYEKNGRRFDYDIEFKEAR